MGSLPELPPPFPQELPKSFLLFSPSADGGKRLHREHSGEGQLLPPFSGFKCFQISEQGSRAECSRLSAPAPSGRDQSDCKTLNLYWCWFSLLLCSLQQPGWHRDQLQVGATQGNSSHPPWDESQAHSTCGSPLLKLPSELKKQPNVSQQNPPNPVTQSEADCSINSHPASAIF